MDEFGNHDITRDGGSPVKVIVKANGRVVAGIPVSALTPGTAAVTKSTGADGAASFMLLAGRCTVHAADGDGAASQSFNVVHSTTTQIVALALAPVPGRQGSACSYV